MTTNAKYLSLYEAVNAIAARCDGAHEKDGQGFNGHDTKFGRRVAAMPVNEWDNNLAIGVYEMLKLYKKQLEICGISYGDIPDPDESGNGHDDVAARDKARQAEYARKNAPFIEITGGLLKVWQAYSIKGELKSNGFRWALNGTKTWDAELNSHSAAAILGIGSITLNDAQREILEKLSADYIPAPQEEKIHIDVSGNPGRLNITTEFGQIPLPIMRALPGRYWNGKERVNVVDAHIGLLRFAEEYSLNISEAARAEIERHRADNEAEEAAAKETLAESLATDTNEIVALSGNLYSFQRAGSAYAVKRRRVIIADEMGLGKTRQALSAAETTEAFPLLIVCPATLRYTWLREIKALMPHRSVQVYIGRNNLGKRLPMRSEIIIIGYPTIESYIPALPMLNGLICDESHYIKNEKAGRTKAILTLCGKGHKEVKDGYYVKRVPVPSKLNDSALRVFLTGTPVLNRPKELVQQLVCLGYLSPQKGRSDSVGKFLYKYCGPEENGFGTTFNGATNLDELNEWLRTTCMIRRTKDQVLTELPAKIRAPQFIALSPSAQKHYNYLAAIAAEKASQSSAAAIVELNGLRTAIGKAKIDQALEWANDFLETGKSLVIFADHKAVQNALIEGLKESGHNVAQILGGQKDVEAQKEKFQSKEANVIVLSFTAAREGHTLTAASDVLFVELGWNPGTHNQAEDRCHRIGQDDSVTAWYIIAQDTIDQWTYELIEHKRQVVDAVTDGRIKASDNDSVFSEVLDRLLSAYR